MILLYPHHKPLKILLRARAMCEALESAISLSCDGFYMIDRPIMGL